MSIKDDLPSQLDIDQMEHFDKKMVGIVGKIFMLEGEVGRSLKDVAEKIKKSTAELQKYKDLSAEMSRNYIQLVNRDSDIVANQDLQALKEHISQLEITIRGQTEIYDLLLDLANRYGDFNGGLKDLNKNWDKLSKKQFEWRSAANELTKAKAKNNYEKYDKIEKSIRKKKDEVVRAFNDKKNKQETVKNNATGVNKAWNQLKNGIRQFKW